MKCGICGHSPLSELLVYGNMPNVAQNLPDDDALRSDRGVDLRICQCGFCGTVQLDNAPVPYYREVIRATWVSEEMRRFRSSQFSDFINRFGLHGKKIIEIGCGSGENLRILKESGAEPYGLEYSEKSVLTAKSMGLSVYQGFVDSSGYKIGDTLFDGFYTFSYLEHLPNPAETLKGVYNNLSDGAYGIVEVPNMDMFVKEGVFYEFMLDHLFYFTKDTLCTLLRLSGFDVLSCGTVWHDYIISAVVKKNKTLDLSYMEELRAGIISQIDAYIGSREPRGVAVWGASHQAFFIMAMLNKAKNIKYVVDSAEFKQGRYTPVSHVPIVPPDKIASDPVNAIIVMAGSYSDEVASLIRERFNDGIDISMLRPRGLEIIRKDTMKSIVLTGATGMIGSAMARIALEQGMEVLCIAKKDSRRIDNLPKSDRLKIVRADLSEYAGLEITGDYDVFYHLAWEETVGAFRDSAEAQVKNIQYALDAARLAKRLGCRKFVGIGSQAEYGAVAEPLKPETPEHPESSYGITKYTAGKLSRQLCEQLELEFNWVRVLSVYGPADGTHTLIMYAIRELQAGRSPEFTKCEQVWDYLYSDDAAAALLAIGAKGVDGKTYPLGSGQARRLSEYLEALRDVVNPTGVLQFGKKEYYPHQPMHLCADISELTADTGWRPEVSFTEGVGRIIAKKN
ncbi:hypothetical protein R80B4_02736 [Fibrobacteres bacterium R8-0-B4]